MHEWRKKRYGRLTGADIEGYLRLFQDIWAQRAEWARVNSSEDQWREVVTKLISVPNWTGFYQDTFFELIAKAAIVAGMGPMILEAAKMDNPASFLLSEFERALEDQPEHPASLPIAFAMIGNLDAIARYSRSVNDMMSACKGGDLQALFDALSVDSYVSTMPFFQAVLRLGQLSGDSSAADEILKAIKGPHRKRIEYAQLRWAEYLLRDQDAFAECSREDIYDLIVSHLGIYDAAGKKKDAKAALFKLFRSWQIEAGIQNPRFGFSAKRH